MLALGNDFTIALDCDALAAVTEVLDQGGNGEFLWELASFAVDDEIQHAAILAGKTEACRLLHRCRITGIGARMLLACLDVRSSAQSQRVAQ